MSRLRLYFGIAFAAPVTLLTGLFYILPFWALGWYSYIGRQTAPLDKSPLGTGWAFLLNAEKAPTFLNKYWRNWAGHCVGSTIVLKHGLVGTSATTVLNHELHHVDQMHRLGFLQPILYALASLAAWASGEKPYQSNVFEQAARRAAGQIVDTDTFVKGFTLGRKVDK